MADKQDSGDKTELPTPKKLRDARNKGDVAKSKDMGAAIVTGGWLILIVGAGGSVATRIVGFTEAVVAQGPSADFNLALVDLGWSAAALVVGITAMLLVPAALLGVLAEYMQIGAIMTGEKLKLSFDKMNPVEGLKRMFGKDGLVELVKTLFKALLVIGVVAMVLSSALPEVGGLVQLVNWSPVAGTGPSAAEYSMALTRMVTIQIFGWIVVVFLVVAVIDRIWTKHRFIKKMMMSKRDIKQEFKQDEGDPHMKGHRKQLHQEWASSNAISATGGAAALLVNPTHIAVALDFDPDKTPVPVVAAKGEGHLASMMRAEAVRAGVPIIRNVASARTLWARGEVGEIVPEDMFDAIAEVILWARRAKEGKAAMDYDLDREAREERHGSRGTVGAAAGAA